MDIKLACTHQYHLFYENIPDKSCEACGQDLPGRNLFFSAVPETIYTCLRCKIRMHESCLKKLHHYQLPPQINHPLLPQQHLRLRLMTVDFICNKCAYISSGYRYASNHPISDFTLDLKCAFASLEDRVYSEEEFKKKIILHYSHVHELTLFKYRKVNERDYNCNWCEKHLSYSQLCYGCYICKFFLHESCSEKIPRTIHHPFHPSDLLRLHYTWGSNDCCNACGVNIGLRTSGCSSYCCHRCNFRLDFRCAKLFPTLKHDRHNHLLACFGNIDHGSTRRCKVCVQGVGKNFYRCVQCRLSFHLECLPIPSLAEHKYHRHPLVFTYSVKEDDSDEYYCDICEDERNPMEPVYCCSKCSYIAHIHCVLNKEKVSPEKLTLLIPQSMDNKALLVNEVEHDQENEKIGQLHLNDPFLHEHAMRFRYIKNENAYCHACRLKLTGPSYICTKCPIGKRFYLHEKCTQLPYQIQHPFHSNHSLYLYTYCPSISVFKCDECGDICRGFIYLCERCDFKLDVKCIDQTAHKTHGDGVLQQKVMEIVTELHPHKLLLGNSNDPITPLECFVCELSILGPVYFCPSTSCFFDYVHESCLQLPKKLQLPFHDPKHTFVLRYFFSFDLMLCSACHSDIQFHRLRYSCEQCHHFNLHTLCAIENANSSGRPLKCDIHVHNLYYFGANYQLLSEKYRNIKKRWQPPHLFCAKCHEICSGSFYRCLHCEISFHLECISLPFIIKSRCHIHSLILKDSFIEDNSGEYYCDVCEEERHPNDHTYYCEECNGLFVAHIECVFYKVEKGLSYKQNPQRIQQIVDSPLLLNCTDDESPIHSSSQEEEEDSTTLEDEEREDSIANEEEDSIADEEEEDSSLLNDEEKEDSTAQQEGGEGGGGGST